MFASPLSRPLLLSRFLRLHAIIPPPAQALCLGSRLGLSHIGPHQSLVRSWEATRWRGVLVFGFTLFHRLLLTFHSRLLTCFGRLSFSGLQFLRHVSLAVSANSAHFHHAAQANLLRSQPSKRPTHPLRQFCPLAQCSPVRPSAMMTTKMADSESQNSLPRNSYADFFSLSFLPDLPPR